MVALREQAPHGQGWQPDRRASTMLALLAAILVCLGFLGLLYRPAQPIVSRRVTSLFLQTPLSTKTARRQFVHTPQLRSPAPVTPQMLQIPPPIVLETLQDLLDAGTRGYPQEQWANGVFVQQPQPYDELSLALREQDKPRTSQQGEGYRSEYGGAIVKSGSGCAAMQEVQVAPGGAKALVGFAVPCPGEHRPTIGDQLADWAKKVRAEQLPPP